MSQKIINTDDLAFLLYEMLDIERFTQFPRYEDHSRDTFDAAIELALLGHSVQVGPTLTLPLDDTTLRRPYPDPILRSSRSPDPTLTLP